MNELLLALCMLNIVIAFKAWSEGMYSVMFINSSAAVIILITLYL